MKHATLSKVENYQVNLFKGLIRAQGQGLFWRLDNDTMYAQPNYTLLSVDEGEYEVASKVEFDILNELFEQGWGIQFSINSHWNDDGGQGVEIWIASKSAQARVERKADAAEFDKRRFLYELAYMKDAEVFPEDYIVYASGPI